jgi:hypothetical protein
VTRAKSVRGFPTAPASLAARLVQIAIWLVLALPALYQIALLVTAIAGRLAYPYDLEWMEGGMLHHAQRIRDGAGIYVPASIDFIPFLYTPLYPSILALFGGAFGITYLLGRTISVLALVGCAVVSAVQIASPRHGHPRLGPPWAGVVLALGLFCAYYPITGGWYDIARADMLFVFLVTAGIAAIPRWVRTGRGRAAHAKMAAAGAVLALSYFTKQTGVIYVALGGALVLVLAWRRVLAYATAAVLIGAGGTLLLEQTTDGWFWTYASKIHRAHDFSWDRFWSSFSNILWRPELPGMPRMPAIGAPITMVIVLGLVAVAVTWHRHRTLPRQTQPLLLWSATFAVSIVVGALGFGTEFAHFNAYMPAFLHGAMAAGAAIPAIYACVRVMWGERERVEIVATTSAVLAALPLAVTCLTAAWSPARYIPSAADEAAGDKLVAHMRAIDGDIWVPSHPWYPHLAGKPALHAHRMGIKDVTWRQNRTVVGLVDALKNHQFAALFLDSRDVQLDIGQVKLTYRPQQKLPDDERPHVYTGAGAAHSYGGLSVPDTVWVPAVPPTPPAGVRVAFDFEQPTWNGWERSGPAWGNGPVAAALPGQDLVLGATGARFATSMHGGDAAVGRVTSPSFALEGKKLTLKIGGNSDENRLYVSLVIGKDTVAKLYVPQPGGDKLRELSIDISTLNGKQAELVLVDESPTGHLDVDDAWLRQ